MDTGMRGMAEEAARLLLHAFREQHKDWDEDRTPLDELVVWLGFSIETFHPDDEPNGTYGYVDPDENERLIWLRRNLPETLRRFTLAHELGHVILHCHGNQPGEHLSANLNTLLAAWKEQPVPEISHADPCHDNDVQESMTGLIDQEQFQNALGSGQQYDPRSQREIAANFFAAELLMPFALVHTRYLEQPPASLAATFAVSNAAMLNRLAGMLKLPATPDRERRETPTAPTSERPTAKKPYDEFQRAAIEAPTPALIVAGPGSGKTSTLIGRAEYIIRDLGVPAPRVLALTFSRKAAQEME
ncbi:MAG TPA: ImmA/IrrE family metallo-endopeptidase, partial [Ktedonobacteraceae bacterium]|nr:ImmA/IrrE family metallo-endopeptidase [Ktedonobacteraceae bacterium]